MLKSTVNKGWVLAIAMVLVLPALACITIEFGSPGKTPEPTVVGYRTPPMPPTPLRPTLTPTQPPIATPTSPAPLRPSVSEVFFAARVTGASEAVDVATEFPEGTTTVYAFAKYAGMSNGTQCESVWYRDGEEAARTAFAWALGDSGETWIDFIQRDGGLLSGQYNWELLVEGELIAGGVFAVGVPGAATPLPEPTATSTPARGPRIAFVSLRDGNNEIYLMNADGSGVTRLTNNPAIDYVPACSWDGTRIAFMTRRDGNNEIYVMNSNGSGVTRVTNDPADEWDPAWSPDGARIAFVSIRAGNNEIYVMNANGSGVTRVTNSPASDRYPSWSPDGARIAFTSYRDGNDETFVINSNGTGITRLTNNSAMDYDPSWSPDGTRIVFVSNRAGNEEIYVMNTSGGGVTRLTNNPGVDLNPAWTPDGGRIAFVSNRSGNEDIYVMNADGTGVIRLTNNPANDWYPSWCPG